MDVLSPLDSAFLRIEGPESPLHIGSAVVLDGPAPDLAEVRRLVASKLPLVPRYRQRVQEVPLWLGRPVWVDDPDFAVDRHVRLVDLPAPATEDQLRALCADLFSRTLDRDRPLWEVRVVTGLEDGRWAFVSKVHHCMVDGVAGTDLLERVLDVSPEPSAPPPDTWTPQPPPSSLRLVSTAVTTMPRPLSGLRHLARAVAHPRSTAQQVLDDVRGLATWTANVRPASASSLTGSLTRRRDWGWVSVSLADVRKVRSAYGGTVNDVVLGLVTGAYRDLLLARHEELHAHSLRTLVPVSVRPRGQVGHDGEALVSNRVSAMVAELPVHVEDPVDRYARVRQQLEALKASGEAEAGELVTTVAGWVQPTLLSLGLYGGFRLPHRQLVSVTTNVPGPPVPLWAMGRRVRELHPFVPIADRLRTGVAVTSYEGTLFFGVTADAVSTPDLAVLTEGIGVALRELLAAR